MMPTYNACYWRQGVFWDSEGGRLAGEWRDGALAGPAHYARPTFSLTGEFAGGLPRGVVRFVRRVADTAGVPQIAAAHLLAGGAVTLAQGGRYAWPAGDEGLFSFQDFQEGYGAFFSKQWVMWFLSIGL